MRTWGRAIGTALWFAAFAGYAQLGVATATGAVRLDGVYDHMDFWTSQLVWLVFFAMQAALAGTMAGLWAARLDGAAPGLGVRFTAALSAAVAAAASVGTVLLRTRSAEIRVGDPVLLAGVTIAIGAGLGLLTAIVILTHRAFGWNAAATVVAVWLVFAASVALAPHDGARLGVLTTAAGQAGTGERTVQFGPPIAAALIGLCTALIARAKGHHRAVVAISGAMGPSLIGFAYAVAGPGEADYQHQPWLAALIAVGAGLLPSVAVAAWPRRTDEVGTPRRARTERGVITAEIPITDRDTEYVGWVSGLTDPANKPLPPRQRRSTETTTDPDGSAAA